MYKKLLALASTMAAVVLSAQTAWALIAAPPALPVRIVNSDLVFVGKVTSIEPAEVEAKPFPTAAQAWKYRVAVVTITQSIRGVKEEKTVRVGFLPPVKPEPGKPIVSSGLRNTQLTVGQEGLFMINKHATAAFYQAPGFGYFIGAKDRTFDEDVKTAKKAVVVLANPIASLKSKDAEERLLAASIQIAKHRTPKAPFPNKQEPIDALESKLILDALVASKWQARPFGQTNGYQLFLQLGVTPQDGWKAPTKVKDIDEIRLAVQEWMRTHPDYCIKRFVPQADR